MGQLKRLFVNLSWKQRLTILAVAVLVGVALLAFSRWRRESDFRPLFTGLAQDDAAAMVQKLKESGTDYRVSEGGDVVSVPSARVAELRLEMAAAGLPRSGRIGFELFDKSSFGSTEFVEHINYRRALEGELERSVMSLAEVERARVHLTFPKESVFLESREPAKASVMVRLRAGTRLSPQNVTAVTHLVGSAVEGLAPEAVSVLDMQGNLLNRPRRPGEDDTSEGMLEFRRKIERDLLAKINTTLEPLLGPERFRAAVSVECDFTSGEQSDETLDPGKSVMVSSEKTEESGTPSAVAGVPGTPSNLPRPAARPAASQAGFSRRSETIAYQTSRTVRRVKLPQGGIKRLSASVLLDQPSRWEKQAGQMRLVFTPTPPELLKSVRDIVGGITGFNEQRGDQLIVESLPFETTRNQEPPLLPSPPPARPADWTLRDPRWMAIGAGARLLLLVLAAAAVRKRKSAGPPAAKRTEVAGQPALPPGASSAAEEARRELESKLSERAAIQQQMEAQVLSSLKVPPPTTKKTEVLVKEIKESVKRDTTTSAHVLRTWLDQLNR